MEWKVVNAISRDVERQHLNKILAEIKGAVGAVPNQQTIANTVTTIIRQQPSGPPAFAIENLRVVLTGNVAGSGQSNAAGLLEITTTVDPSILGVPEAPNTGQAFWRRAQQWAEVPTVLAGAENFQYPGVPYIDEGTNWVVADTDLLPEGAANLYFTDERTQDAVGTILDDTADVEWTYDDTTPAISAMLSSVVHDSLDLADTALQPGDSATEISFAGLQNAVDDAAAAALGVSVNDLYRNGSILMIRVA